MSSRQPLLILSPSPHHLLVSPNSDQAKHSQLPEPTTPKLPKRERLNSISRLLKNKNFTEFSENPSRCSQQNFQSRSSVRARIHLPVDIRVSPCSPTERSEVPLDNSMLLKVNNGFLSPNNLPFSPRLLNRKSPSSLSPSYRYPSPLPSPLYSPDQQRFLLGRGSFGKVTLCRYRGTKFAVKTIHNQANGFGERNFLGVRHPHLVEIFHISSVIEETLVFMEFAGNCNLQQILDTKGELDFRRRLSFCIQTASGLRHCHQNFIIHGDVKPANVIVNPMGMCKIGDFGLSSRMDGGQDEKRQQTKDFVGTAVYAAPEVLKGSRPARPSDIYSFGIFLWQLKTREMPFAGEHPHVVIYKVVNYGTRPKFREATSLISSRFMKIAEECWRALPSQRIDADKVLSTLQGIMQSIKDTSGN